VQASIKNQASSIPSTGTQDRQESRIEKRFHLKIKPFSGIIPVRSQKSEVRSQKSEVRSQKTEDRRQPVRRSLGEDGRTELRSSPHEIMSLLLFTAYLTGFTPLDGGCDYLTGFTPLDAGN